MSEIIQEVLERLGQDPSPETTSIVVSLHEDADLTAWREIIARVAAIQARNRRDAEFEYPSAQKVVETLRGGQPANIRDLRALVTSHLRQIGEDLRHGSTDGYKALWNVDPHARPVEPAPEDYCRDRLLESLRPRLEPAGVLAEPEGHYADDKRSDIHVLAGPLVLPVEIKRHYNAELWTAPHDQLRRRYSRDPRTHGHGIYLVLWFGLDRGPIPKPPSGVVRPDAPDMLATELLQAMSDEDRASSDVIVLDCATPAR